MHPILADRQRLRLHLVAWCLVGGMIAVLVRALTKATWLASLSFGLPLGLLAAPISLSAWYLCRAMPVARTNAVRIGATTVGAALVTASLWAGIGRAWWQALGRLGMPVGEASIAGPLMAVLIGLGGLAYVLAVTVHYVLQASEESAAAARRALESQVAQRDAELRALRAQIDPHFLFNSLHSIAGLIAPDPGKAREMCQLLGEFLRDSLKLGASARIALGREVALAQQYLRVEQVRFGARLSVRAQVSADSAAVPVPPLILQPLVENAVRHGVGTRLDGGLIEIETRRAGDRAVIVVANPRDVDGSRRGTGLGLDIVRRRLGASFGDRAALAIEAAPESYRVSVTIPVEPPDTSAEVGPS
jgi:signal transduction histidine kinase